MVEEVFTEAEIQQAEELGSSTESSSKSVMSAAVAAGAVTGDFGSAWNMMNTLQLLAFIPMMPNRIPI